MRNPLNSILAQCQIQASNIEDFWELISSIKHKLTETELVSANDIVKSMKKSNHTLETSSQLLLFNVEDVLGLA